VTIPEVRKELRRLAEVHRLPRLAELAEELHRRPAARRAKPHSRRITPDLSAAIRNFAAAAPELPLSEIAHLFSVNQARASEAIRGKRT
jgi:hypothetical protein